MSFEHGLSELFLGYFNQFLRAAMITPIAQMTEHSALFFRVYQQVDRSLEAAARVQECRVGSPTASSGMHRSFPSIFKLSRPRICLARPVIVLVTQSSTPFVAAPMGMASLCSSFVQTVKLSQPQLAKTLTSKPQWRPHAVAGIHKRYEIKYLPLGVGTK